MTSQTPIPEALAADTTAPTVTLTTGQLLTLTSDLLACPIGDVYAALNALTGDDLYTHQLPRAAEWVQPHLARVLPWAAQRERGQHYVDSLGGEAGVTAWVRATEDTHGAEHTVPGPSAYWTHTDPLQDLLTVRSGSTGGAR